MTEQQWFPIDSAPYGRIVLVRNNLTHTPVRATRGYVHADQTFFTSVYTPDYEGLFFPAGRLVCPTEWTEFISSD